MRYEQRPASPLDSSLASPTALHRPPSPPWQLVVRRNPSPDPRFQPETATTSLVSYDFKPGARALFLGRSHYGCMATVLPDASAGLTKKVGCGVGCGCQGGCCGLEAWMEWGEAGCNATWHGALCVLVTRLPQYTQ